jgi:hypothetical protein
MSVATANAPAVGKSAAGVWPIAQSAAVISFGLYALALSVRVWAASLIHFPLSEGSAYYSTVAANVASGRGLVIDAIWSYATPPLTLPRPAFELWQPLASLVFAAPMAIVGQAFAASQLGSALVGAVIAPLAWFVARDTTARLNLPERRAWFVAVGAGALTAVAGPMLLSAAIPDSYVVFTVVAVAACAVMAPAVSGNRAAIVALGALIGLAYLTRMEAVWLGVAFVVFVALEKPGWRIVLGRTAAVAAIAAVVAIPWWVRNLSVFGSALPGQVADNVFLTYNEQIYAYVDQPTFYGWAAQGPLTMLTNVAAALWHNLIDVLVVPVTAIVVVGLLTVAVATARRASLPTNVKRGAIAALLVSGTLTFVTTSVAFPVATLWGTFEHASGPLLVGITVSAVVGGDAFVAWLVRRRSWERQNAWMAPAALLAITIPIALFQLATASRQASAEERTIAAVTEMMRDAPVDTAAAVITDRPIWLSDALDRPTLALPTEPASTVLALARVFGAQSVVVVESRAGYPAALAADPDCFTAIRPALDGPSAFVINPECVR